jgi:hypothetical protein
VLDVAFRLEQNEWQGIVSLQARIVAMSEAAGEGSGVRDQGSGIRDQGAGVGVPVRAASPTLIPDP